VFVHVNDLVDLTWDESLRYRRVEFDVEQSQQGLRARNCRAAD
jgi:cold shock CspA family protein